MDFLFQLLFSPLPTPAIISLFAVAAATLFYLNTRPSPLRSPVDLKCQTLGTKVKSAKLSSFIAFFINLKSVQIMKCVTFTAGIKSFYDYRPGSNYWWAYLWRLFYYMNSIAYSIEQFICEVQDWVIVVDVLRMAQGRLHCLRITTTWYLITIMMPRPSMKFFRGVWKFQVMRTFFAFSYWWFSQDQSLWPRISEVNWTKWFESGKWFRIYNILWN